MIGTPNYVPLVNLYLKKVVYYCGFDLCLDLSPPYSQFSRAGVSKYLEHQQRNRETLTLQHCRISRVLILQPS